MEKAVNLIEDSGDNDKPGIEEAQSVHHLEIVHYLNTLPRRERLQIIAELTDCPVCAGGGFKAGPDPLGNLGHAVSCPLWAHAPAWPESRP